MPTKIARATLCLRSSGNLPNVGVGDSGDVRDMRFALGAPFGRLAQYAGFFVLNPPAFKFFADRAEDKFSIVETFLDVLRSGGRLAGIFDDAGDWADIGTLSEYARAGRRSRARRMDGARAPLRCGIFPRQRGSCPRFKRGVRAEVLQVRAGRGEAGGVFLRRKSAPRISCTRPSPNFCMAGGFPSPK